MFHSSFRKIGARIGLIVVMLLGMMTLLVVLDIYSSQRSMRSDRAQSTRRLVEVATTVLGHYAEEQRSGRLSRQQAQAAAAQAVSALRYDGTGYFWINDLDGRIVMHPIKPRLDGSDGRLILDVNKHSPFGLAADIGRQHGSGVLRLSLAAPRHHPADRKDLLCRPVRSMGLGRRVRSVCRRHQCGHLDALDAPDRMAGPDRDGR